MITHGRVLTDNLISYSMWSVKERNISSNFQFSEESVFIKILVYNETKSDTMMKHKTADLKESKLYFV